MCTGMCAVTLVEVIDYWVEYVKQHCRIHIIILSLFRINLCSNIVFECFMYVNIITEKTAH